MATTLNIPAHSFGVKTKDSSSAELGGFSFKLLIVFFIFLYSSLPLLFPILEIVRPALTVGGLALLVLAYEKFSAGQSIEIVWPDGWLMAGFVVVAGLSILAAVWPAYALDATMNLAKTAVIYVLIVNTVSSEKRLRTLLWVMVWCGLFPAIGSIWYSQHGLDVEGRAAWIGLFANPNEMAYGLVVLIPLAVGLARRSTWLGRICVGLLIATFLVPIYLSYSRGSLIGLVAVVAYMGLRQKSFITRFAIIAALAMGLAVGIVYWHRSQGLGDVGQDANFQERLTTYRIALAMYADSPVFGVGINCSSVAWPLYATSGQLSHHKWLITHNTLLQALGETGTVGFVLLVSFFAAVIRRAWKLGRANIPGRESVVEIMATLEIAFWGFLICGLSGGYVMSWFPYLLAGFIGATGKILMAPQTAKAEVAL